MRRLAEALVLGFAGAGLGAVALLPLDLELIGGAVGGANGFFAGGAGIYGWKSWQGWFGFLLDSTWGLVGTTFGLVAHGLNLVWPGGRLDREVSERSNMFVYVDGYRVRRGLVISYGNVVSNAGPFEGSARKRRLLLVARHEGAHVWQSRLLGPVFQASYAVWFSGGVLVGSVLALSTRFQWFKTVEALAYYDNPFEYFAYRRDENWPPPQAEGPLWRGRKPLPK